MQGVRWAEFFSRNRKDVCPYFRRVCKAVAEKSDHLPEWFNWQGDNLVAFYRRMQDGEWEAYEIEYVRKSSQFVRKVVLLVSTRTREAWLYPYSGFIPKTITEFRERYTLAKQVAERAEGVVG